MSGNSIFLDSNILIYLLQEDQDLHDILQGKDFIISFITELELLTFPASGEELDSIKSLLSDCFIVDINKDIKSLVPELRLRYKLKLPDAILCATAIFLELPLLTSDRQLAKVQEATVIVYEV